MVNLISFAMELTKDFYIHYGQNLTGKFGYMRSYYAPLAFQAGTAARSGSSAAGMGSVRPGGKIKYLQSIKEQEHDVKYCQISNGDYFNV